MANRTCVRKAKDGLIAFTGVTQNPDNLRDHITSPLDYDAVANPDIFTRDFVFIMQSGI